MVYKILSLMKSIKIIEANTMENRTRLARITHYFQIPSSDKIMNESNFYENTGLPSPEFPFYEHESVKGEFDILELLEYNIKYNKSFGKDK